MNRVAWLSRRWPDLLLLGVLVVATIGQTYIYDEGWILFRSANGFRTGEFLEFFWAESPTNFQGNFLEFLYGAVLAAGVSYWGLDVLQALVASLPWFIVRRWVIKGRNNGWQVEIVLVAFYLSLALAWLGTMRPEGVMAALLVLVVVLLPRVGDNPNGMEALAVPLLTGVAASIHQEVVLFTGPLAIYCLLLVDALRKKKLAPFRAGLIALVSLGVSLHLLVFQQSLGQLRFSLAVWLSRDGYRGSEFSRWSGLFTEPGWKWWPILLGLIAVLFLYARFSLLSSRYRLLLVSSTSAGFGIVLTGSTWIWHIGALVGLFFLIGVLGIEQCRKFGILRGQTEFLGIPIVTFMALAVAVSWGPVARSSDFALRYHRFGATEKALSQEVAFTIWVFLIVALATVSISTFLWDRRRHWIAGFYAVVASVSLLLPFAQYAGAVVADTVYSDKWTLAKQRLAGMTLEESCGLQSEISIVSSANSISGQAKNEDDSSGPFGLKTSIKEGRFHEIEFFAPKNGEVGFWVSRGDALMMTPDVGEPLTLVLSGARLNQEGLSEFNLGGRLYPRFGTWSLVLLQAQEGRNKVYVYVETDGEEQQFFITDIAELDWRQLSTLDEQQEFLINPAAIPYFPCANLSDWQGPYLEQPDYVVAPNMNVPRLFSLEGTPVEVGRALSRGGLRWSVLDLQIAPR